MFDKFFRVLYGVIMTLCKLLLVAQVLVVSWVVFGRFVLNKTPSWGEEGALLCMVWFCLMSATLAIKDDSHLKITVIDMILPGKVVKFLDHANYVLIFVFALFMLIEGVKLTQLTMLNVMPGLGIKSSWLFAAIPVTGAALILALIDKARELFS